MEISLGSLSQHGLNPPLGLTALPSQKGDTHLAFPLKSPEKSEIYKLPIGTDDDLKKLLKSGHQRLVELPVPEGCEGPSSPGVHTLIL